MFYGCNNYPDCDYTTWDTPLKETCPECGSFLLKHHYKNGRTLTYCSNDVCKTREGSPINEELAKMRERLAKKHAKDEAAKKARADEEKDA